MFGSSSHSDISDEELRDICRSYSDVKSSLALSGGGDQEMPPSAIEQNGTVDSVMEEGDGRPPPPLVFGTMAPISADDDGPPPLSMGVFTAKFSESVVSDELKNNVIEMGSTWIQCLSENQRKVLADAKRKIIAKFNIERDAFRAELAEMMKSKLEEHRDVIEKQIKEQMNAELVKFVDAHTKTLAELKTKQWCKVCLGEAKFACCWNTSYCGTDCQTRHWPMHQRGCRRVTGAS